MKSQTYTKRDIAIEFSKRKSLSIRNSQLMVEEFFDILKEMLIEDNPYTRIEIRNFGVFDIGSYSIMTCQTNFCSYTS